ncbi:disco-interacting protein 2-like protein A [Platysternon megacephalum]|uniref:Disco-interacting protein 2-like protein A n=1 Tax=Platysternon megacephalum TaxID=55544 RepID=A0A4D9E2H8_9SAUR|nr:disco-interacting protein 2-like protein A [Platysternon megacephalum]
MQNNFVSEIVDLTHCRAFAICNLPVTHKVSQKGHNLHLFVKQKEPCCFKTDLADFISHLTTVNNCHTSLIKRESHFFCTGDYNEVCTQVWRRQLYTVLW